MRLSLKRFTYCGSRQTDGCVSASYGSSAHLPPNPKNQHRKKIPNGSYFSKKLIASANVNFLILDVFAVASASPLCLSGDPRVNLGFILFFLFPFAIYKNSAQLFPFQSFQLSGCGSSSPLLNY